MMSSELRPTIRARFLTGPFERMRGLLGRDSLPEGEVYVFPRCRAVHTLGMRFTIDIVFLDRAGHILSVRERVRPGRWLVWGGSRAVTTVESAAGWLPALLTRGEPFPGLRDRFP